MKRRGASDLVRRVRSYTPRAVFILFLSCLFCVNHHKLMIVEGGEEVKGTSKKVAGRVFGWVSGLLRKTDQANQVQLSRQAFGHDAQ